VVKALVRDWKIIAPDDLMSEIQPFFPCEHVEIENLGDNITELKFFSRDGEDFRPHLGSYLMKKNVGLLNFQEEQMNLEEIFINSTKG
jgi:hypothetical protein